MRIVVARAFYRKLIQVWRVSVSVAVTSVCRRRILAGKPENVPLPAWRLKERCCSGCNKLATGHSWILTADSAGIATRHSGDNQILQVGNTGLSEVRAA